MISFTLKCRHGHEFEGLFGSSADYDDQQSRGLVTCPFCDSSEISKSLMTPQLPRKGNQKSAPVQVQSKQEMSAHLPQGINPDHVAALYSQMREMQNKIVAECDDVGDRFAEEARKIHYGETEERGIYGQTSKEEAEALAEEGIEAVAMPWLPPEN